VGRLLEPNPYPRGSDLEVGGFDVPDNLSRVLDYSREGVRRSIESSLGRLGTDFIDVVYVHDPDDDVEQVIRETFPALEELRDEGVIRAIGAGMNSWEPLRRFVESSNIDIVMLAGRWTLLDRSGRPLLDECLLRNVAVVAAAPFNSGLLASSRPQVEDHFNYTKASADVLIRASNLAASCESFGVELPCAALQFPLRAPAVASVVVGIRNASEALEDTRWFDEVIPEGLWNELESGPRLAGND
jgi:D-threo-aldose 1-dehydrogenase